VLALVQAPALLALQPAAWPHLAAPRGAQHQHHRRPLAGAAVAGAAGAALTLLLLLWAAAAQALPAPALLRAARRLQRTATQAGAAVGAWRPTRMAVLLLA
jgi:hypothetical protein